MVRSSGLRLLASGMVLSAFAALASCETASAPEPGRAIAARLERGSSLPPETWSLTDSVRIRMETSNWGVLLDTVVPFLSGGLPSVKAPVDRGVEISAWGFLRSGDTLWSGTGSVEPGDQPAAPRLNAEVRLVDLVGSPRDTIAGIQSSSRIDSSAGRIRIHLWTTTPAATVRYTLDGSTPDGASPVFPDTLVVAPAGILKACASRPGWFPSAVLVIDLRTGEAVR